MIDKFLRVRPAQLCLHRHPVRDRPFQIMAGDLMTVNKFWGVPDDHWNPGGLSGKDPEKIVSERRASMEMEKKYAQDRYIASRQQKLDKDIAAIVADSGNHERYFVPPR